MDAEHSRKREKKIRVGEDELKAIPTDLHKRLYEQATRRRYSRGWDCVLYALDRGLSLMEIEENVPAEMWSKVVEFLQQNGTKQNGVITR